MRIQSTFESPPEIKEEYSGSAIALRMRPSHESTHENARAAKWDDDDSSRRLIVNLSSGISAGADHKTLAQVFCEDARTLFGVSGTCCWILNENRELQPVAGDGCISSDLADAVISLDEDNLVSQAISSGKTIYQNGLTKVQFLPTCTTVAKSAMVAPVTSAGRVIGALALLHDNDPVFFREDTARKAMVFAGVLGSFMQTARFSRASAEERRRAEILVQCAETLQSKLDTPGISTALAGTICSLLQVELVAVLLQESDSLVLHGIASPSPEISNAFRMQFETQADSPIKELSRKAISARHSVLEQHAIRTLDCAIKGDCKILAVPLTTSRTSGALVVYCEPESPLSEEEQGLLGALANLGALAISNSEFYEAAQAQSRELQQLLDISSELSSVGELNKFLERFVVHATEFLGFARAFIALKEEGVYSIRCVTQGERACPLRYPLPMATVEWIVSRKEAFWSEDVTQLHGVDMELASMFSIRQLLSVPLLGSEGEPLGLFCVMDKLDSCAINPEDVRRAKALSAQISVALEATQNLHLSNVHRRRTEDLVATSLELNSSLHLPEFAKKFTARAIEMMEARAAALVLSQRGLFELAGFNDSAVSCDRALARRLSRILADWSARTTESIVSGTAVDLLGAGLSEALGWANVLLARMTGHGGEVIGVLAIADGPRSLSDQDRDLLQALVSHASVSLENSRLFTRMDQANRHWLDIFDSITDYIVVHDDANRVLRVNRSFADFIGVSPQELIGFSMKALAMAPAAEDQPCPFCRSGAESVDEYIHPVLEKTYLVSTSLIHGASTESLQTIHVLKDISDRREAERRYRELFDNIQEGLYFSSPEGRFIEVNEALVRMLGYDSREELLGVDIPTQVYIAPEHRARVCEELDRTGVLHNFESTLQSKNGTLIHTIENAVAVRDSDGRMLQYRGMMMDVTALKNFQAELQRERDFSSKILNNTQSLIMVVDTAGLISYANRRCYQSCNFKDLALLGRPLTDIVLPSRRGAMLAAFSSTLEGRQVDNLEVPIMLANGRVAQFSINLSPMRDEQGNVNSIVVVMTDITDASMLQAKLMHSDKMAAVGRLVSGVAHEVNNPLTAVLGFSDLLLGQDDIPEAAKDNLRIILQEAQRTKQIVQNLLSFARQRPPKRQLVNVNTVLRRTLSLRTYDFSNRDIMLNEDLDEKLPEIFADEHQLQQVFLNIINNAYDAVCETGRKGQISVKTTSSGGFAEVLFTDNGNGVEHPERIFDPFFTTKDVGKGTGLGLSICYGIVHEHGGDISCRNSVNSDEPGATFIVRLPLKVAFSAKSGGVQ